MSSVIEKGSKITMHFSLKLENGSVVDSSPKQTPASLTIGDGNLPKYFEQTLFGLTSGDRTVNRIPPEKAFGHYNQNNVKFMPRSSFPSSIELQEGLVMSFADAGDNERPGVITGFDDTMVEVDFNHPLSGRQLIFEVQILDVQ